MIPTDLHPRYATPRDGTWGNIGCKKTARGAWTTSDKYKEMSGVARHRKFLGLAEKDSPRGELSFEGSIGRTLRLGRDRVPDEDSGHRIPRGSIRLQKKLIRPRIA
jgi:hypothetical protein